MDGIIPTQSDVSVESDKITVTVISGKITATEDISTVVCPSFFKTLADCTDYLESLCISEIKRKMK